MTSRERVLRSLDHHEPDRVPIDVGGSVGATAISVFLYGKLKEHLGIRKKDTISNPRMCAAYIDLEVLRKLDMIDTCSVNPHYTFEFPETTEEKEWQVVWGRSGSPGGYSYNPIRGPFGGHDSEYTKLPTSALEEFGWPEPSGIVDVKGIEEKATRLRQETDYALVLELPAPVIHRSQYLRGYANWLKDIYMNPDFFSALLEKVTRIWIEAAGILLERVGDIIDVVFYGDDIGTQNGPLISPSLYRNLIKPHHKAMIKAIKAKSQAKIVYHTCGGVAPLLSDFAEEGVDCYNPVQPSAKGNDLPQMKKKLGDKLAFWGGVDVQKVLPEGTTQDVRKEVKRRISQLAEGGGYVLSASHIIQPDVPLENFLAMLEAAVEYGRY